MQAKRIQVLEEDDGVGGSSAVSLEAPTSPREEINYHNIWGSVTMEPQTADANAQGTWVMYILRENANFVNFTDVVTNGESNNAIIIACGVWSASNQTPYTQVVNPKTSRTLQPGDRLVLGIFTTGVSAGLVSNRMMLCAHTTRK